MKDNTKFKKIYTFEMLGNTKASELAVLGIAEIIQKSKEYSDLNKLPKHYQWIVKRSFELGQIEGRKEGAKQELEDMRLVIEGGSQYFEVILDRIEKRLEELEGGVKKI